MKRDVRRVHFLWPFLMAAGAATSAGAQVVQQYAYQPDAVYEVNTGLGITTQVVLSPEERILDYSTGFSNGWDISRRGNVFYLRPRSVDVDTDMIVRTEAHSYILELHVVATDWKTLAQAKGKGVRYKVAFNYAAGTDFHSDRRSPDPRITQPAGASSAALRNFGYEYASASRTPAWFVPAAVYDDGRFTYIKMRESSRYPTGNFPAVFMRQTEHGPDTAVNTTVRDDTIVVHGTYPYLVIRQGDAVVGIRRQVQP